jgi:hypothetical protein
MDKIIKIKNIEECPYCKRTGKLETTGEYEQEERTKENIRLALEVSCDNCGAVFLMYFNAKPTMEVTTITEPQKHLLEN